jgi:DNA replication protein DnaC
MQALEIDLPEIEDSSIDDIFTSMKTAWHKRAGHTFLRKDTLTCITHGAYDCEIYQAPDASLVGDKCPQCENELSAQREREAQAAAFAENNRRNLEHKLQSAAIPFRFKDRTLENYEITQGEKQAAIHAFCVQYAENFEKAIELGTSIILSGGVGTGKTHLSIGIAHHVIRSGYSALFSTVSSCVRRIRSSWRSDTETEMDAMRLFVKPDLLILDEVGLQSGSDNEHQILFEILNARYEQCLPTILLTNLPLRDDVQGSTVVRKGLQSYIGERLLDRMREGGGKAFTFDWKSDRAGR